MKKCNHYWCYRHLIISGRKKDETAIVRHCNSCKRKEVAFIGSAKWQKATGDYARDDHYQ